MKLHENKTLFRQAVQFTADQMKIPAIYVEKDYWVTYALCTIFNNEIGKDTVFKGGTALSKCYNMIERFSEDIDLVVLRREGETDSKLKSKLKAVSTVIEAVLPEAIICGQTVTGNTAPFTSDIVLPCVVSDGTGGGVWYRFSGTGTIVTASLCGSSYDTMIRIYSGDCNNLLCVSGNDDFCNLQSQVSWTSTLGTTYFILVHGYNSSVGSYALSLTCANPMCYTQTPISYTPDSYVSGTPLILDDDTHSGIVPIGFNFCYNDNTYSQCVISPNNYITFNID